jgi:hypothetical protein
MSLCALHKLGRCNKLVNEYRNASDEWCNKVILAEEDLAKIKGKALCENHGRHPERIGRPTTPSPPAKKLKANCLESFQSPITPASPKSNSKMVEAATQTDEKIEVKSCLGLNNEFLEKFIEHRFGKTILDEEGYLWGKKNEGWTTFRAEFCTGMARSNFAKRCSDCDRLHSAMSQARAKKSKSSEAHKFVPISSLRISPYVKELLEQFKKDQKDNKAPETPNVDDLEIEVSPCPFWDEILKDCAHFFFTLQNRADNDYLVNVCLKALEENPNIKNTFFGELMKQQLLCATSVRGSSLFI